MVPCALSSNELGNGAAHVAVCVIAVVGEDAIVVTELVWLWLRWC